jgi:hypothetical protein
VIGSPDATTGAGASIAMPPFDEPAASLAGTRISRGRSTVSSSASACMPSAPTYSAVLNSPVDTSRSATPIVGPPVAAVPADATLMRKAGSRASR